MNEAIIIDLSSARSFEQLTAKEKKLVKSKLRTLDYKNPIAVIKFGSEHSREITDLSTQMISQFRVCDFEEAQSLISNLMERLNTANPAELLKNKNRGFIGKKQKMVNLLTQQISIEKAIDQVEDRLVATKLSLIGDIEFCRQMTEKTYEYAQNLEIVLITVNEALKKAEVDKSKMEELLKQNPNNLEYAQRLREIDYVIESLDSKAYDLMLFRTSTLQTVTQISMVMRGDELMVQKIDNTIINVIPLWKRNFALALAVYRLNNAVAIERLVNNATNKLLVDNSKILKNALIQTAEEMQRPSIDPETIKTVYHNTADTLEGLTEINNQQKEVREKALKSIQSIQTMSLQINSSLNINKTGGE